jgi:hypothetical protein
MCVPAVALGDVVGEGEDVLVIAVVPLQRDVDADLVALPADRDRVGESGVLVRSRYFTNAAIPPS